MAVTRWREDATCDDWGSYIYLRDADSGACVVGRLPAERRRAGRLRRDLFTEDRAEFVRRDGTHHHDARRSWSRRRTTPRSAASRSTNDGNRAREIEVTSYAELVLAPPAADVAHPAFSKLFVQTEFVAELGALLATRRRRGPASRRSGRRISPSSKARPWASSSSRPTARASSAAAATSRDAGRGRSTAGRCPTRSGTVLDPDLRAAPPRARSAPAARRGSPSGRWSRPAATRRCSTSSTSIATPTAFERAATLAWTQAQVQLRHLGIDAAEAQPVPAPRRPRALRRSGAARLRRTRSARGAAGQPALWAHGISGDLPIVLVRIDDVDDIDIVAPAAARPRILAAEAARRRSGDPQRARLLLRPGSADRARDPGAHEPVAAAARDRAQRAASSSCAPI